MIIISLIIHTNRQISCQYFNKPTGKISCLPFYKPISKFPAWPSIIHFLLKNSICDIIFPSGKDK